MLKTRLGKRLAHLFNSIPAETEVVWDLCCDHGALGRAIIESRTHTKVIFNDIHPDIMARLSEQLTSLNATNYDLVVAPAEQIKLATKIQQTVIIAGIGDEQCVTILKALTEQVNAKYCRFIVSPTTKVALVRHFMIEQGFYLVQETTVTENHRTYEVISICTTSKDSEHKMRASLNDHIGHCWQPCTEHIRHLKKLVGYYQGQAINTKKPYAKNLLNEYQKILKKLTLALEEN